MKEEIKIQSNKISELRQDLVTGDWVVIATGRSKRPEEFAVKEKIKEKEDPEKKCFFCYPEETGQEKDVLLYQNGSDWSLRVFPNKYPAFSQNGDKIQHTEEGPYFKMDGVGFNELVITRDHKKSIALLSKMQVAEIIDAYQDRYINLMSQRGVNYIDIFHNHGKEAGASIAHPHSQIAAVPVISPYVQSELDGAESYHKVNGECVYCTMVNWETKNKKRIVFENEEFVAFCPFSSRVAFEVWVMPKKHAPYFERISNEGKMACAEVLQEALAKIYKALNNPPYNFYLHTSPCDGKDYPHYHWHIEILPVPPTPWAGFELSTGMEVSTIEPEVAAEYLKNI